MSWVSNSNSGDRIESNESDSAHNSSPSVNSACVLQRVTIARAAETAVFKVRVKEGFNSRFGIKECDSGGLNKWRE